MTDETRRVEVEIEVPGTPEEVWEAIATGPGISCWFVPTEVEEREGGAVRQQHGAEMDIAGHVQVWDPPHRFKYGGSDFQLAEPPGPEPMADEFIVEARSGGTCIVRVVTSGFGTGADWDRALEGVRSGWTSALQALRLYLTHFPGERCFPLAVGTAVEWSADEAWDKLTRALGLAGATEGDRVTTAGAPTLAGVVERTLQDEMLLRIDAPAPGLAAVYAGGPGDQVYAFVRVYLYGDAAAQIAAREEPAWRAWLEQLPVAAAT
jgi:uncharacterized protein YndB with AHSA1/START domain